MLKLINILSQIKNIDMLLLHEIIINTRRTRTTEPNIHTVLLFSLADEVTVSFQQAASFSFTVWLKSFGHNTNHTYTTFSLPRRCDAEIRISYGRIYIRNSSFYIGSISYEHNL